MTRKQHTIRAALLASTALGIYLVQRWVAKEWAEIEEISQRHPWYQPSLDDEVIDYDPWTDPDIRNQDWTEEEPFFEHVFERQSGN